MNSEIKALPVIEVSDLEKAYHIYDSPHDRLKQIFFGWKRNYYRDFLALKEVSFEVLKGQSVGVIGRNGAGKSTLLQLLTGTLTPTKGSIKVNGKVAAVLELGSGFNPEFSGRENIYLYASLFELKKSCIEERFQKIVDFSELADFIDQPVKAYSSGMQARLAFSVIAHVDADILIIDEALSVGDAFFAQKCMRFLRQFQEKGTILFVSHDLAAVTAFCDHAIWLEGGAVREAGSAKEVCENYFAQQYMQHTGAEIATVADAAVTTDDSVAATEQEPEFDIIEQQVVSIADGSIAKGDQEIECFGFNEQSSAFGTGGAEILKVSFTNESGHPLIVSEGGAQVVVKVVAKANHDIDLPILGFTIKDRLGQPLIGGNTYHSYKKSPVRVEAGKRIEAAFHFKLPILAIGDYSIVAAIANGTLQEHVQLHWMHDAVLFKVAASSIDGVIVGAPLDKIILTSRV
ncbi:ABC transporter ATP-binding protein [Pseudomonas sp. WS 5532]|uniref:ABC transporter ATP-binding protein n=1 Tax=unclassified Pseudomonas TaxID=196821 RepID=UPI0014749C06|nr:MULTISPECIES: ABC transporter ATP-binding protein [unclassified Pseudomonas]NMX75145.1 ABC transporter ATP-binding protein [Pseudomonas sp. WS 5532]QXI57801.1 ABC transporter ATP-binding protein [Pseudomonas sp. OE 28.3]